MEKVANTYYPDIHSESKMRVITQMQIINLKDLQI